jgi:hypothetical protein
MQVFSEVFGDYIPNRNLDFKVKHAFFGSTSVSGGVAKRCEATAWMTVDIQSGTACYLPY